MKLKSLFPNKGYDILFLCIFLFLGLYSLRGAYNNISDGWYNISIQDFLYNFGGGFIRRGLGGEIIFFFQDYLHIPALILISTVCVISYLSLFWITTKLLLRKGYSWNLLILSPLLGGILIYQFSSFRRDYLELLLFAITLILYKRLDFKKWIVAGNIIMTFAILLHESTLFFTVPAIILITNSKIHSLLKSIAYWSPALIAFISCCVFKGSPEMMSALLSRASIHAPQAFEAQKIPQLLNFIGQDTIEVFKMHLRVNFDGYVPFFSTEVPRFIFTLLYYIYIPYLSISMLISFTPGGISKNRIADFIRLLIFQFICLLPMWTILSCDFVRVSLYWMMSTLLIWLILSEHESEILFPHYYIRFIKNMTNKIHDAWIPNRFILTILSLCTGVVFIGPSFYGLFSSSIVSQLFNFTILHRLVTFIM